MKINNFVETTLWQSLALTFLLPYTISKYAKARVSLDTLIGLDHVMTSDS